MSSDRIDTSYRYHPGPENICQRCNGFLRWPDGLRLHCTCRVPNPSPADPDSVCWTQVPYRTREQEHNEAEGWCDGNALAR